eukprot:8156608-Ditylum_brightwellii.AAC.1
MNMQYFLMLDQVQRGNFDIRWMLGQENIADYPIKHHTESPRYLSRAQAPRVLQGCAETPGEDQQTYNGQMPLSRVYDRTSAYRSVT